MKAGGEAEQRQADDIDKLWQLELVLAHNMHLIERFLVPSSVEVIKDGITLVHQVRMQKVSRQVQRRELRRKRRAAKGQ